MPVCPECGEALSDEVRFCPHDGAQLLAGAGADADPLIGTMIGSYRVAGMIGAGGMGRVYMGLHPSIGSRRGRLPPDEVLWLGRALLTVLAAAHARGVIHRDLKPANIFVTRGGRVVVLDFGIAKLFPERPDGSVSPATRDGAVLGTPSYMSPEQIQGRPPTAATDLYALGIILFQALSGQLPFDAGNLFELLQKHVSAAPPPLRALAPEVSPALEAAVFRSLAKAPGDRYASAVEMAAALDAAAAAPSVQHRVAGPAARRSHPAPSQPPSHPPSPPRSRAPLWITAAVVLAGALGLSVWAATRTSAAHDGSDALAAAEPASVATDAAAAPATTTATAPATTTATAPPTDAGSASAPAPARPASPPAPNRAPAPHSTAHQAHSAHPAHAHAAAPADDPAVTHAGGVTFIDTAALARQKTGLHAINTTPPARLDPVAYLATAQRLARRLMPDARLTAIRVEYALVDGSALLRTDDGVDYTFRSPSHSHRPADLPANVEVDIPCLVRVWVRRGKVQASPVTDETCHQALVAAPRCTTAGIWRMAFPRGPPARNLAAQIDYDSGGWDFSLSGAGQDVSTTLRDTCR